MRVIAPLLQSLVRKIRVAPSPTPAASSQESHGKEPRTREQTPSCQNPFLTEVPPFILLEREVEEEFRPRKLEGLQSKLDQLAVSLNQRPECCGVSMRSKGKVRVVSWITRYGDASAPVKDFRCSRCRKTRRPLLEHLGVEPGRVSGSLARLLALLGVVVPYQLAAHLADILLGTKVSAMTVWRCVQRLGEGAERLTAYQTHLHTDPHRTSPVAPNAPDAVLLGVDGAMLGMQVRTKRRSRRRSTEALPPLMPVEDGHFREVKTGVLLVPSERFEPSPGRRSALRRILVSCLGNADEVFVRLWSRLSELGWTGTETLMVIVGDGSEWIWNRATMFPNRVEILDFWHAIEYAWSYANLQFGEGSAQGAQWVHRLSTDLREGKVLDLVARLKALHPVSTLAGEALETIIGYYTNNAARMQYDEYLRRGFGIGSGAIESAHKQVVHSRLRQAGMRWSEAGAQRLLALRILLLNGEWSQVDHLLMIAVA